MTSLLSYLGSPRGLLALATCGGALLLMNACSSESAAPRSDINGANGNGGASTSSAVNVVTSNTGIVMTTNNSGVGGTTPRDPRCDDQGNCSCINIAMFGRLPTYGAVPGMDGISAVEAWLNANSSAAAQTFVTKPTLTAEFLGNFDVIVLQALETVEGPGNQWQFSAEETAAFEAWVRAGGGVIALSGYGADPSEATPTNNLLAFSGLKYAGLTGPGDTALEGSCPDTCCYCNGNSIPSTGWVPAHPISANVTAVGAYYGRSVSAPAGAGIVAQMGSTVLGATVEVDAGRVFMFHDEWVTYTSQWDGTGLEDDCRYGDPNNACNDRYPANDYQVPQFWYNALRWVSGDVECFDIRDPEIIK